MGFFDDVVPSGDDAEREEYEELRARRSGPDLDAPPRDWVLPAALPWAVKLGEGPLACVALERVRCWPDGVSLDLVVFRLRVTRRVDLDVFFWNSPPTPGTLRFGVLFADGRRVTNFDRLDWPAPPRPADSGQPMLQWGGGGGGGFYYQSEVYLSPLPPEGPLTLVVEWPDQQMPETRTELDAAAIRAAAAQALEIWSDLPPAIDPGETGSCFTVT